MALVLDCGYDIKNNRNRDLREAKKTLDNATEINVIISHAHTDHYNLLKFVFGRHESGGIECDKLKKIYIGFVNNDDFVADNDLTSLLSNKKVVTINNNVGLEKGDHYNIIGYLGTDVNVNILFPQRGSLDNDELKNNIHLQNLVISINHKGYKMLFPGDAGFNLLRLIYNNKNNKESLVGIRFILASHHGSINSNEDRWLAYLVKNGAGLDKDLTCVISQQTQLYIRLHLLFGWICYQKNICITQNTSSLCMKKIAISREAYRRYVDYDL